MLAAHSPAGVSLHPVEVVFYAAATLVALVVHEYAHAVTAARLGDQTPRMMGRQTLNPKAHVDPFGTFVLPALLLLVVLFLGRWTVFAYAKPMPLNPWNLKKQTRDIVLVQVMGILANLVLAILFGILLVAVCGTPGLESFLRIAVQVNLLFAAIHIVPMPPLDGARAIAPFLPPRAREVFTNLEQYAPLFILLVFFILGGFFFAFVNALYGGLESVVPGVRSCPGPFIG